MRIREATVSLTTSSIRNIPSEVILTPSDGMAKDCAINLDHIQTVSKSKVESLVTTLNTEKMTEIRSALLFALGFVE